MTANHTEAHLCSKWTRIVFGKLCFHFFNKYNVLDFICCEMALSFVFSVSEAKYYIFTYSFSQSKLSELLPSYCSDSLVFWFASILRLPLQTVSANKAFDLVLSFLQQANPSNPIQAEGRCSNTTALRTAWFCTNLTDKLSRRQGDLLQVWTLNNFCTETGASHVCRYVKQDVKKVLQQAMQSQLKPFVLNQIQLACGWKSNSRCLRWPRGLVVLLSNLGK